MVFKTLVETTIIGGVFRLSFSFIDDDKSGFVAVFAKQEQKTGAVHESNSRNDQNSHPYVFIK